MKSEEYDLCIKYRRDYVSNLSGILKFPELLVPPGSEVDASRVIGDTLEQMT